MSVLSRLLDRMAVAAPFACAGHAPSMVVREMRKDGLVSMTAPART